MTTHYRAHALQRSSWVQHFFATKITKARTHEEGLRYSVFFVIFVIFVVGFRAFVGYRDHAARR